MRSIQNGCMHMPERLINSPEWDDIMKTTLMKLIKI